MRISPKKYAQTLYELVEGKNEKEIKETLEKFVNFLIENQDTTKADKIIEQFEQIWNKKNQIVEAKATTSVEVDKQTLEAIEKYIKNLSQAEKVNLKYDINKEILGGVVIRYKDKLIDASLRTQIKQFKSQLIK
jgi:F-type H+-transporting ATPase subunit delta